MDRTQKTILYVTTILLAILLIIIFGKIFMFERGKEKTSGEVDSNIINKLYNYLPDSNDYQLDSIYSRYSSFENININTIEKMIVNYLYNNEKDKLENINDNDLLNMGIDSSITELLYKVSKDNLNYGLKMVFGENRNVVFKDVSIDKQTRGKYYNDYLYIYKLIDETNTDNIVYRNISRYSIENDKTIKIYDSYIICDKVTMVCYSDDKKSIVNASITYSNGINFANYENNMKQYEHIFKYNNGNYKAL